MILLAVISIIAVTSAALLPARNYLPQSQGPNGQGSQQIFSQGGSQQSSYQQSQFQSSQSSFVGGGSGDNGNRRPQQAQEKNSAILKMDQEITDGGFHYSYETSNGIRAEEAGNTVQTQGGFSYKGDDGITYTVTFTAGEGGFRPQGAHLPVPPPIPADILAGLQQNAKDEAAGIFDDGKYRPDVHGGGKNMQGQVHGQGQGSFGSSSSGQSGFSSTSHQASFNPISGYKY